MPLTQPEQTPHSGQDLQEELRRLVCQIKNSRPDDLGDATDYASVLGFDSLDFVELSVRLDTDYGVVVGIEPGDLEALATLGTLTILVRNRRTR